MRITYFTNIYPAVSHTFIRREIRGLDQCGHAIERITLRGDALVDPEDLDEAAQTLHLLKMPAVKMLWLFARRVLGHPVRAIGTMGFAIGLIRRSRIPLLKMVAYFVEACLLAELCRAQRTEHLRVHFGTNGAVVARLCRRLGGPGYSVAYHGPNEFDAAVHWDIGGVVAESVFVTAITSFCAAQIRRWTPTEYWDKVRIVRCAVDERFLEQLPIPRTTPRRICTVARLSAQKGQTLLFEGFAEALGRDADLHLDVVGDGELRSEIESLVVSLGIQNRVVLHGSLPGPGVREILAGASGLVLPSFAEGLPVVLMEAMGLARPVITTTIAGVPELVDHENGWLIPAGDVRALSDALVAFSRCPVEELEAMGARGHRAVEEKHSIEHEVGVLDSILRSISVGS